MKKLRKMIAVTCVCSILVSNLNISVVRADTEKGRAGGSISEEAIREEEITRKTINLEITTNQEETVASEETTNQEEATSSEETTNPKETTSSEETTNSEETMTSEETTNSETITVPETTTIPETTVAKKLTPWGEYNGNFYNDKGEIVKGAIAKGIDVSKYQGQIDWEKVSKSDVEFVILRCGYGDDIKKQDDKYFKRNVAECEKYGIPYGVYLYSYAQNLSMAKSEVKHVLRMIKEANAKPVYPVYLDMEDNTQYILPNKRLAEIADYFCSEMIKNGYQAGVYANLNWWNTKLTDKSFNQWHRWIAQYNSYCGYRGFYQMWQFTSTGVVNGVAGDTDINFLFFNECQVHGHITGKGTITKKATVFKKGEKRYYCNKCGLALKIKKTAKLKPTGRLNRKKITLKVRKKYKKLKVKNMARGDSVKKYKSSNKKIVKVSKKGIITAGKNKGKATITVILKSGKKLKLKVTIKK